MEHPELFDAHALNTLIAGMPSPNGKNFDGTAATVAPLTVDTATEIDDLQPHGGDSAVSTAPPSNTSEDVDKGGEEGASPRAADGKREKDIRREARIEKYFKLKRRLLRADLCIICLDTNIAPTVALLCCGQAAHIKCLAGWYAADSEQQQHQPQQVQGQESSSSGKSKCPCPYCRHQLSEPEKTIKTKNMEEAAVSLTSKILARSRKFQDSNSLTENIIAHMTRYDASQRRPGGSIADSQETGSVDSGMGGGSSPAIMSGGGGSVGGQQISPSSTNGGGGIGGIAGMSPKSSFQMVDGIPYPSNVSVKSSLSRTNSRSDEERSVTGEESRSSNASPNFFAPPPPAPPAVAIAATTTSPAITTSNHSFPRTTSFASISSNHSSPTATAARKMGVAETMIAPNGLPYPKPAGKR